MDIITGILFLLIAFVEKPEEKKEEITETQEKTIAHPTHQRFHSRDVIINPKKPREN